MLPASAGRVAIEISTPPPLSCTVHLPTAAGTDRAGDTGHLPTGGGSPTTDRDMSARATRGMAMQRAAEIELWPPRTNIALWLNAVRADL